MYLDVCERDTSRYKQDTCKIHHDTTGYAYPTGNPPPKDRKPPVTRSGTVPTGTVTFCNGSLHRFTGKVFDTRGHRTGAHTDIHTQEVVLIFHQWPTEQPTCSEACNPRRHSYPAREIIEPRAAPGRGWIKPSGFASRDSLSSIWRTSALLGWVCSGPNQRPRVHSISTVVIHVCPRRASPMLHREVV